MWISFVGMGLMFFSLLFLYLTRFKLKGTFKIITGIIAYVFMIAAGLIIFLVVLSGPTD
ncbi:DUF2768 domain-containing protein [Mesobacillus harenae]|uniref:DUF2768 domain-containing protein n=1 Tax=Mesobacillus harenae TaxID=2213203 RepID=UPI0030CAF08F